MQQIKREMEKLEKEKRKKNVVMTGLPIKTKTNNGHMFSKELQRKMQVTMVYKS